MLENAEGKIVIAKSSRTEVKTNKKNSLKAKDSSVLPKSKKLQERCLKKQLWMEVKKKKKKSKNYPKYKSSKTLVNSHKRLAGNIGDWYDPIYVKLLQWVLL